MRTQPWPARENHPRGWEREDSARFHEERRELYTEFLLAIEEVETATRSFPHEEENVQPLDGFRSMTVGSIPPSNGANEKSPQVAFSKMDLLEGYGIRTVAPRVMPDSMASCAFTASFSGYS